MPRPPRELKPNYCYHITVRCNNREFKLSRPECREVFLYAIKKAQDKFNFKLYALCIMSNHVHYLGSCQILVINTKTRFKAEGRGQRAEGKKEGGRS